MNYRKTSLFMLALAATTFYFSSIDRSKAVISSGSGISMGAAAGGGSFNGPASSTDNAVVRFNGTAGDTAQDSSVLIDDSDNMSGVASLTVTTNAGIGTAVVAGTSLALPLENDAVTPTLAFGDGDSGFYESTDDNLAVAIAGAKTFYHASTYFGGDSQKPRMMFENSSSANPVFVPRGDAVSTGIGAAGFNIMSVIVAGTETMRFSSTKVGIGTGGVTTNEGDLYLNNSGVLALKETTTPTADASIGKLYTKSDNILYFQDGGGTEQEIGGKPPSYSSIWYHGAEATTTISTANTFTDITTFDNVGYQDAGSKAVGNATNDDITIGTTGTGNYRIALSASFRNDSGANKTMMFAPTITLNSAKTITDATNATPIVITSASHGLKNGDMVTITGVGGNTAANGDFYVSNKADNTFELETLSNVDVAGNGAYTSGGSITKVYPGDCALERIVSGTDLGRGSCESIYALSASDVISASIANKTDTNNLVVKQIVLAVERLD